MNSPLLMGLLFAGACLGAAESPAKKDAAEPSVEWAVKPGEGEGWRAAVVKLRAQRQAQPLEGVLQAESVKWKSYHDVNASRLVDGRVLSLDLTAFGWKKVDAWPAGKELLLCYEAGRGATLYDPETRTHLTLWSGVNKQGAPIHPIDGYLKSLEPVSTQDLMAVAAEASYLWRLEIDRCVKAVLAKKHLPDDVRRRFVELSAARLAYGRAQARFAAQAIQADIDGTVAGPMIGDYEAGLYRDAYFALAKLADSYQAFDRPPGK